MARTCAKGRHRPSDPIVSNQGFDFSRCSGCSADLIRSGRSWKIVPRGFRVVWRGSDRPHDEDPAQLLLDLPVGSRALVVRHRRRNPLIRLGGAIALALAGLLYLAWSSADRLRRLFKGGIGWSVRRRVPRLPAA